MAKPLSAYRPLFYYCSTFNKTIETKPLQEKCTFTNTHTKNVCKSTLCSFSLRISMFTRNIFIYDLHCTVTAMRLVAFLLFTLFAILLWRRAIYLLSRVIRTWICDNDVTLENLNNTIKTKPQYERKNNRNQWWPRVLIHIHTYMSHKNHVGLSDVYPIFSELFTRNGWTWRWKMLYGYYTFTPPSSRLVSYSRS